MVTGIVCVRPFTWMRDWGGVVVVVSVGWIWARAVVARRRDGSAERVSFISCYECAKYGCQSFLFFSFCQFWAMTGFIEGEHYKLKVVQE